MAQQKFGKQPSQRQLRVGETIRRSLPEIMTRETFLKEGIPFTDSVTFTEVRMSPDLRHATIFAIPLGGGNMTKMIESLKGFSPQVRFHLSKTITWKYIPQLHFEPDLSFDNAENIQSLLNRPRVQQDLQKKA